MPTNPKHAAVPKRGRRSPKAGTPGIWAVSERDEVAEMTAGAQQAKLGHCEVTEPADLLLSEAGPGSRFLLYAKVLPRARRSVTPPGRQLPQPGDKVVISISAEALLLLRAGPPNEELNSEICERALRLIGPTRDHEIACRTEIALAVAMGRTQRGAINKWGGTKTEEEFLKVAEVLRKAASTIRALSEQSRELLFCDEDALDALKEGVQWTRSGASQKYKGFVESLDQIMKIASSTAKRVRIRKGAPPFDVVKFNAAGAAFRLLTSFAAKAPTLTTGGQFYQLASMLYEGQTGRADTDLSRYCRRIFSGDRPAD